MKNFFLRIFLALLTPFIILGAAILIVVFHIAKYFHKTPVRDPFHNSRRHPLNSPEAPRG